MQRKQGQRAWSGPKTGDGRGRRVEKQKVFGWSQRVQDNLSIEASAGRNALLPKVANESDFSLCCVQKKVTHSCFETTRPTRSPVGSQFTLRLIRLIRLLRLQDGPEVCQQKLVAAEDLASAQELEPALCSPLRSLKVHESVIESMRVNAERAIFTDFAQDGEKLPKCARAFGIDRSETADFPRQREMAELIGAWRQAKAQYEVNSGRGCKGPR